MSGMAVWSVAGWTMLHFLWAGSLFAVIASIIRIGLRGAHPDVRYAYSLACLGVLTALPAVIAGSIAGPEATPAVVPPAIIEDGTSVAISRDLEFPSPSPDVPRPEPGPVGWATLAGWLPWLWLAGAPITFARLALGLAGAERLRSRSRRLDEGFRARADALGRSIGLARSVAVAVCDGVAGPILLGIVRPLILLPPAALTGWTPEAIEMVLLHELAHVRRRDNLVNLLQRLTESALFFHPAVWVVSRWARVDRELGCDRLVVARTGRPLAYARTLFALGDRKPSARSVGLAMAEGPLLVRIRSILKVQEDAMKPTRLTLALCAAPMILPVLLLAAQVATKAPTDPKADAAREVVAEAVGLLRRPGAPPLSSSTLIEIARAQATLGDRDSANRTFREAAKVAAAARLPISKKGNMTSYGLSGTWQVWRVAHARAELGDKAGALETLRTVLDPTPDEGQPPWHFLETLAVVAREFADLGAVGEAGPLIQKADDFFKTLPQSMQIELIFPPLAAVHMAGGDVDGAFAIFDQIDAEPAHDVIKQSTKGHALAKMAELLSFADRAAAQKSLERMVVALEKTKLPQWQNSAIDVARALAKVGEFEAALKLARGMGQEPTGMNHGTRAYALSLIAHERRAAGDLEGTRETLREAQDDARLSTERDGRSSRLQQIAALRLVDDIPGALICVDDMAPGRRSQTLVEIGRAQRARGDEAGARATFVRAIEDAAYPKDHAPRPGIDAPDRSPMPRQTESELSAIADRGVAVVQAASGDFATARRTADAIPNPTWRAFALAEVARAQAASGDVRGALAWVRELKDLPNTQPSPLEALIQGTAQTRTPVRPR